MKEWRPNQINLRLHFPAIGIGGPQKRLYARILGNAGEGVRQEGAAGIGDAHKVLMRRREDQSIDECWVKNPEQMTKSVGMETPCGTITLGRGQGQGTAEELGVVAFIRFPYPDVVVEVLGEINKDTGKFAERIGRQL